MMRSRERLIEVVHSLNYAAVDLVDAAYMKAAARMLKIAPEESLTFETSVALHGVMNHSPSPHMRELAAELLHYCKPYIEKPFIAERLL